MRRGGADAAPDRSPPTRRGRNPRGTRISQEVVDAN